MFTPQERARLRSRFLERAANDDHISGAAITGSAAEGNEDDWSDIDLAFAVADPAALSHVLADWTAYLYEQHDAVHHVDMHFGAWIYRVFLLPNTLQLDLAFVPANEFRALSPTFQLVFGKANTSRPFPVGDASEAIGLAWLHALHARSSIARGRLWQAEYMISGIRDHALAVACIQHGVPSVHGRGLDQLPAGVTALFEGALVRRLELSELSRAFRVAIDGLLGVIRSIDEALASRLKETLIRLSDQP